MIDAKESDDGSSVTKILNLDQKRLETALQKRIRYKYVQPRILQADQGGWWIVSPNCSRNVDPEGGEILIAWLQPTGAGWTLHRRCHAESSWLPQASATHLPPLLDLLVRDEQRLFWV